LPGFWRQGDRDGINVRGSGEAGPEALNLFAYRLLTLAFLSGVMNLETGDRLGPSAPPALDFPLICSYICAGSAPVGLTVAASLQTF